MIKIIAWWLVSGIFAFFLFEKSPIPTFGLSSPYLGKGHTEPYVIRPNENVKLMVGGKQKSINGLFRNVNLEVIPLTMIEKWKNVNFETIKDEETWDDDAYTTNMYGHRRYYFKLKDSTETFTLENITFLPWIKFKTPADSSFIGSKQQFIVKFDYTYPYYLENKEMFQVYKSSIKDTVSFEFGTIEKIKKFDAWQDEVKKLNSKNSLFDSIKYISVISFIISSIFLFLGIFDTDAKKQ